MSTETKFKHYFFLCTLYQWKEQANKSKTIINCSIQEKRPIASRWMQLNSVRVTSCTLHEYSSHWMMMHRILRFCQIWSKPYIFVCELSRKEFHISEHTHTNHFRASEITHTENKCRKICISRRNPILL